MHLNRRYGHAEGLSELSNARRCHCRCSGASDGTYLNLGAFISGIIYFIIYMAVVYFLIVMPYKLVMARRGKTVFGDPAPTKPCPECL
jgi:large conductance mechanosensitive channel